MGRHSCSWQLSRLINTGWRRHHPEWFLAARFARTSSGRPPENPFPDFNNDSTKQPPKRPVWDDDTEWEAALGKALPPKRKSVRSPLDDLGDFILSIAVRRKLTGYALLRFSDLHPLQFGIVDVSKHGPDEAQKKALEIAAALRDLREVAPQKMLQLAADGEEMDSLDEEMKNRQWKWIVALDDSTVDRGPPVNVRENRAQRTICVMQGLLIADCKKIFKTAPQVLNPRRSRQRLNVRGGPSPQVRKEIFEEACREVADFPIVRHRTGTLAEDTYLMSDAWATGRLAQREVLMAHKREDQKLMTRLREQAMASKQVKKLIEVISELHPRKESKDLSDVLEKKVDKIVEDKLNQIVDEDLQKLKAAASPAEVEGPAKAAEVAAG